MSVGKLALKTRRRVDARSKAVAGSRRFFRRSRARPQQPWVEGRTIGQVLRETARRFADRDAFKAAARSPEFNATGPDALAISVDELRERISALGWEVRDTKDGPKLTRGAGSA